MQLTVYLGADDVRSCTDLLDLDARSDNGTRTVARVIEPVANLGFDCLLGWAQHGQRRPQWMDFLAGGFELAEMAYSTSPSAALAARVDERVFAVTFGHGRHLVRTNRCVHDFGLRVTANSVGPDCLRAVERHGVGNGGRRQVVRTGVGSRLAAFGYELNANWVHNLRGDTDDDLAFGMSGSQSLQMQLRPGHAELKMLPVVLAVLLARYGSTAYREYFDFIDLLRPVPSERGVQLDQWLVDRLLARQFDNIGVGAPQALAHDEARVDVYRARGVGRGVHPRPGGDVSLSWLSDLVRRAGPNGLDHARLAAEDVHGNVLANRPLREYLVAEQAHNGRRFVLSLGRWFEVDDRLFADVERGLSQIDDYTDRLDLPVWDSSLDEREYCVQVAAESRGRWVRLDRQNFAQVPGRGSIEICDLMDERQHLVCVKKLRKSATLSHLFSQGSVSAVLFGRHEPYRQAVRRHHLTAWPGSGHGDARPVIVYAVGVEERAAQDRDVRQVLPFFSRVNVIHHAHQVRGSGLGVGLAKVAIKDWIPRQRVASDNGALGRARSARYRRTDQPSLF